MNIKHVSAKGKYLKSSSTKLINLLYKIRNKSYQDALNILEIEPKKRAKLVWKVLQSAISNAANNYSLDKNNLNISAAFVNRANILKRIQPRAKGKSYRIKKRFSHITIIVTQKSS